MRIVKKAEFLRKCRELQRKQELFEKRGGELSKQELYEELTELQSAAAELGTGLEQEQACDIVRELELYCEQVYQCSLLLTASQKRFEQQQKMRQQLQNIEKQIEAILAKAKIAFFPYKISMWDSLESIWEAASKDKNCECQLVPIPYYTKDDKGELKEKYYEGEAFVKSAPIIDYNKYCMEKECPDMMYIHNPYDQYNKVTMVEPAFFSTELKKGGGILVYVPYYISGYCRKYENMLSTCGTIGAIHSDFIIMQCEHLKEAYMCCGFPEKRLLTLGSPKIDAVQKIPQNEYEIVDKWKPVVDNRKVILLNTSISTCLQNEEWLEIIKGMVEPILRDKRLALIWRPHPLLLDSIKTLQKEETQYGNLLQKIKKSSNAVIDDTQTAEAAMKISDAMISDYSSLVMQYSFTGKPMYLLTGKKTHREYHVFCDFFSNYFKEDGDVLEDFLETVACNKDTKREERIRYARNSMENTDGTCGEKIHRALYKKMMERLI